MNWLNFKGVDVKNLFGISNNPKKDNQRSTLAIHSVDLVNKWNDALENVFEYSKMYDICKVSDFCHLF
jgi:hypothetical protein